MARYMGGPRCRRREFRRRPTMLPPRVSRQIDEDEEDEEDEGWEQTKHEVPDSDDFGGSSQTDYGDVLQQEQSTVLEGKKGNGVAYDDEDGYESDSDSDSEPTTLIFPGLQGREYTEIEVSDNEPRLKRARSMSIPIYHPSPFSTGMLTFQPPPLPISYGWMVRGTAEHVEDLHLSGVPFCSKEVRSRTKIEVLGEYTWIEVTPSQEETYERFPAIYVPGNARTWRPVQVDTDLHQKDVQSIVTQKIRDDNTHRQPRYPYEPALRALEAVGKVTSLSEVDVITDADTLTQLLAFIMGTSATRRVKEPFRLELKTVRNTLFIHPSQKPGSSQAGPPNTKIRHDPSMSVPDWAAGVLGHIGSRKARLPYSGGHYRLVRYRFGNVVLAVRVKVDFVYEHRKDAPRAPVDPLRDVQPEFMPHQEGNIAQVWKTTVKRSGLGTRPAAAGITSVRYTWQDQKVRMRALLPQLWFSRTPFVVDCKVSYPDLSVKEVSLVNSRQWYTSYERGYQNSLRRLAGLLKHLQVRTLEMGGDIVLVADPAQVCFVLLKPVIKLQALPEDLALKFWGPAPDTEDAGQQSNARRDSTPEDQEAQSDLTDLSDTPSLPAESDIAPNKAGGSPAPARAQPSQGIDSVRMVSDWNNAVDTPVRRSVEEVGNEATPGYLGGDEATPASHAEQSSFDGNRSSSPESVMVGESAQEAGVEGPDGVLNSLAVQMNRPGVRQESHESLTAVARAADVEVLRRQHSLLLADRHLTSGMHDSSDDEWPPRRPAHPHGRITNLAPVVPELRRHAHGDMELRSIGSASGSFVPTAKTPPGPYNADVDSAGHVIPRESRRRRSRPRLGDGLFSQRASSDDGDDQEDDVAEDDDEEGAEDEVKEDEVKEDEVKEDEVKEDEDDEGTEDD